MGSSRDRPSAGQRQAELHCPNAGQQRSLAHCPLPKNRPKESDGPRTPRLRLQEGALVPPAVARALRARQKPRRGQRDQCGHRAHSVRAASGPAPRAQEEGPRGQRHRQAAAPHELPAGAPRGPPREGQEVEEEQGAEQAAQQAGQRPQEVIACHEQPRRRSLWPCARLRTGFTRPTIRFRASDTIRW